MRRKAITLSLRWKHLVLYFILFTIPLIILSYIIHFRLLHNLQQEVRVSSENELTQVKQVIDAKMDTVHNLAYDLSYKRQLSPNNLQSYLDVIEAQDVLNYKIFEPFIHDMIYYSRDKGYIFSSNTSYPLSSFINQHYNYMEWSEEDFIEDISLSSSSFVRSSEDVNLNNVMTKRLITYGMPLPLNSSSPNGTLLFLLDEDVIKNMLSNIVGQSNGFAYLLTENGEVLAEFNGDEDYLVYLRQHLAESNEAFELVDLPSERYLISALQSDYNNNWIYVSGTPETYIMRSINDVQHTIMRSYLIIVIIGILLIWYAMKTNYEPLRRLLSKVSGSSSDSSNKTGFDRVFEVIDQSYEKNRLLSERIEKNEPIIQQHLLISLLCGEIESFEEFNTLGRDVNVTLLEKEYFVMLFDIETRNLSNEEKNKIVSEWLSYLPYEEKYTVYLLETSLIAVMISGVTQNEEINQWYEEKVQNERFNVTVGIGTSYSSAGEVGKSHIEANTALNYRLLKGDNRVLYFEEVKQFNNDISWYDKKIIDELSYHIKQSNTDLINLNVEKLIGIIKSNKTNLFMAKSLFFELSSMVMQLVDELRIGNKDKVINLPSIIQISDFESIKDIENTINQMISEVSQLYMENEATDEEDLIDQMIEFIKNNYTDYQLSTSMIAEEFDLSEAYIMRYFKKHTHTTILQYIIKLRMDYSKHLLTTTSIPIKELVEKAGYSDTSSFIRRFKKETKYTPGQYRKRFQ